jgi:hypothetical protein
VLWYNAILSKQSHFLLPQYFFNGKSIQATKIKLQGEITKYRGLKGSLRTLARWVLQEEE